jgi:Protein of unknown function (DUF2950)
MIGGFAAIAWAVRYAETGAVTFIGGHDVVVDGQVLGPATAQRTATSRLFDPDRNLQKAETTPP